MSKKQLLTKAVALTLAASMLTVVQPPIISVDMDGSTPLSFRESDIIPDVEPYQGVRPPELETPAEDEIVRVTIVLEDNSTVAAGYSLDTVAVDPGAVAYRGGLERQQHELEAAIEKEVLGGAELDVVWNLTLAANAISANVKYGVIEDIKALDGVADVFMETLSKPASVGTNEVVPFTSVSDSMIGSEAAYAKNYTGAGQLIAVLDTGIDDKHRSFNESAFRYSLQELGYDIERLWGVDDYYYLLSQLNIGRITDGYAGNESWTEEEIERLHKSDKIPFAYNYADHSFDTDHLGDGQGNHGSHVAGIAAANAYVWDSELEEYVSALDTVYAQGVAPDAQLIVMKVFGSNGAFDSDIMAAVEDAIVLGADAVNLSLGTDNGFTTPGVEYYANVMSDLVECGAVVTVSAGNSGTWGDGTAFGHTYANDVNMQMLGYPASYTNSLAVASADNVGYTGKDFFLINEKYISVYAERLSENTSNGAMSALAGDREYVYIDSIGSAEEFAALAEELEGRIALCNRGGVYMVDKANAAIENGAAALAVVNNEPGRGYVNLEAFEDEDGIHEYTHTAPVVMVTQAAGDYFRAGEAHTLTLGEDGEEITYYTGNVKVVADFSVVDLSESTDYYTMSDFSSWGVTGALELKPEITAPGGSIYSVSGAIPGQSGNDQYFNDSGTSMSAPHAAGMAALISQYIDDQNLEGWTRLDKRTLTQSLLMSTAVPIKDANNGGNYYSVLSQGAGLANVGNAINAETYILMDEDATINPVSAQDGKVKAELGDDPDRDGLYTYRFTIHNLTGDTITYKLRTDLFTQGITTVSNGYGTADVLDKKTVHVSEVPTYTVDGSSATSVTVYGYGEAEVEVTIKISEGYKKWLDDNYANGAYIEGFTHIIPENEENVAHSIPILAFYGSWTEPSMFDNDSDYNKWVYNETTGLPYYFASEYGGYESYSSGLVYTDPRSGEKRYYTVNPYGYYLEEDYEAALERAAINSNILLNRMDYVQIRNGFAGLYMTVDGEPYLIDGFRRSNGAAYIKTPYGKFTLNTVNSSNIGSSVNGQAKLTAEELEDLYVQFTAAVIPEYYLYPFDELTEEDYEDALEALQEGAYYSTPEMIVDNTRPELLEYALQENGGIILTVQDNQYIGYVGVFNKNGTKLYSAQIPEDQTRGMECTAAFTAEELEGAGAALVMIADYAGNVSTYEISLKETDPDRKGELFGLTDEFTGSSAWYVIDPATVSAAGGSFEGCEDSVEGVTVTAAAYADGYVFQAAEGALYVAPISDIGNISKLADLDFTAVDMAVNYSDGMIYAIDRYNGIWAIDPLTGESEYRYTMPGFVSSRPVNADVDLNGVTDEEDAQAILDYNSGKITAEGLDLEAGDLNGDGYTTTYDAHLLLLGLHKAASVSIWTLQGLAIDPEGTFYGTGYYASDEHTYLYLFNWTEDDVVTVEQDGRQLTYAVTDKGMDITGAYAVGVLGYDYDNDLIYMAGDVTPWAGEEYVHLNQLYVMDPAETGSCHSVNEKADLDAVFRSLFMVPAAAELPVVIEASDAVESITVKPEKLTLFVGSEFSLEAVVSPWTAADRTVTWDSEAGLVYATVDENGIVRGEMAGGTTVITATTVAENKDGEQLTAKVEVTVEDIPSVPLNGIIWEADGSVYLGNFDLNNAESHSTFYAALHNYAAGTLNTEGDILYVSCGSDVYAVDVESGDIIGKTITLSQSFTDAAPAPLVKKAMLELGMETDPIAVLLENSIWIIDPITDSYFDGINLISSCGLPAAPAAIDYCGSDNTADHYYVVLENGDLYVFSYDVVNEVFDWRFAGKTGIDLTGAADPSVTARASLLYDRDSTEDSQRLYLSYNGYNGETARIAVIDVDLSGRHPVVTLPAADISFAEGVSSVVSLYQEDRGDLLEAEEPETELNAYGISRSYIVPLADVEIDPDELTNRLYIDDKDVIVDKVNNTVTVTVTAYRATNALYTIAYGEELTLISVGDNGGEEHTWSSYRNDTDNSAVTLDFASSLGSGFSGKASVFRFTYDEADEEDLDTFITLSYIQLDDNGVSLDEPIHSEDTPIEIPDESDPDPVTEFTVSVNLGGHGSSNAPTVIKQGEALEFTITANVGYKLPDSITVTIDGKVLDSAEYTYNSTTGRVYIPADKITGNVDIKVDFVPDNTDDPVAVYTVTVNLSGDGGCIAPTTVTRGDSLEISLTAGDGYKLPDSITVTIGGKALYPAEYTYNSRSGYVFIPADKITGNVNINVVFVPEKSDDPGTDDPGTDDPGTDDPGTVEPDDPGTIDPDNPDDPGTVDPDNPDDPGTVDPDNPNNPDSPGTDQPGTDRPGTSGSNDEIKVNVSVGSHGSTNAPSAIRKGEDLSFTITPDEGYKLPYHITVIIGGKVLDPAEYVYEPATGYVSIPGSKITGKVEISVDFLPKDTSNGNANPNTGVILAVVPVLLSAEAILALRKRKK